MGGACQVLDCWHCCAWHVSRGVVWHGDEWRLPHERGWQMSSSQGNKPLGCALWWQQEGHLHLLGSACSTMASSALDPTMSSSDSR